MLAGQFTNCSTHQILNHTFDPHSRGSASPGCLHSTEYMTQGSAVSNKQTTSSSSVVPKRKAWRAGSAMLGQTENKHSMASRPPAVSVLLPLDDYSSVSLRFEKPDSTVRESEPLLHFHFLCTHSLMNVTVLRQLWNGKWRWYKPQSLLTHSTRINDFQFLFLVIKVAFNSHNWNKIHLSFIHSQFLVVWLYMYWAEFCTFYIIQHYWCQWPIYLQYYIQQFKLNLPKILLLALFLKDYNATMYSIQSLSNWIYMVLGHYYYFTPIWI